MEEDTDKEFPVDSSHDRNNLKSFLDSYRNIPVHVLNENINIVKIKKYRVDDDNIPRQHRKWVDLSEPVLEMQSSVQIFGGQTAKEAKAFIAEFDPKTINPCEKTIVYVINDDCMNVCIKMINKTKTVPLLLNLAQRNSSHVCGKWNNTWMGSQEEAIERRSAVYRLGLDPELNPKLKAMLTTINKGNLPTHHIPTFGTIYLKSVPLIRDKKWRFYDEPVYLDIIAAGGIDLRYLQIFRDGERSQYVGNAYVPNKSTIKMDKYIKHTKYKISVILISAIKMGYKDLVLGALGCGAFKNPPQTVAKCFKEVIEEERFKGAFRNIIFAILGLNFTIFSETFTALDNYESLIV